MTCHQGCTRTHVMTCQCDHNSTTPDKACGRRYCLEGLRFDGGVALACIAVKIARLTLSQDYSHEEPRWESEVPLEAVGTQEALQLSRDPEKVCYGEPFQDFSEVESKARIRIH